MNIFSTELNPLMIGVIIVISIWQYAVKGVALWRAANLKQRNWFIALFVLIPFNDLAILEIIYLFWFSKKRLSFKEIKSWLKK